MLSGELCALIASSETLRSVTLVDCECDPAMVGDFLAIQTLGSVLFHSDVARLEAQRAVTGGATSRWALDVCISTGERDWLCSLLDDAGSRVHNLTVQASGADMEFHLSGLQLRCPHLRRLHAWQSGCKVQPFPPINVVLLRMSCRCGGWRHLGSLLDTGAARIELGPIHAATATTSPPVQSILRMLHRSASSWAPSFGEAMRACNNACTALNCVLKYAANHWAARQDPRSHWLIVQGPQADSALDCVETMLELIPGPLSVRRPAQAVSLTSSSCATCPRSSSA